MHTRHLFLAVLAGGALAAASACSDNPEAPNRDHVVAGSQQTLQSLVTGITAEDRYATALTEHYYGDPSIMARDVVRPDPAEARWATDFYETGIDPSNFIGQSQWRYYYTAIRGAHSLLKDPALTSLPAAQQAAARGFVRTVEALAYLRVIETHDVNGTAIQPDDPSAVGPIKTKQSALAYVSALLDTALLTAGGGAGSAADADEPPARNPRTVSAAPAIREPISTRAGVMWRLCEDSGCTSVIRSPPDRSRRNRTYSLF